MAHLTEEDIKYRFITPAIEKAGWQKEQVFMEYFFTDGQMIVRGKRARRGKKKKADYLLTYSKGLIPLAIVEAKEKSMLIGTGMQQAIEYAEILNIPFAYASNGEGFLEHDFLTGKERKISIEEFPTEEELWNRYKHGKGFDDTQEEIISAPDHYDPFKDMKPRYYQRIAIQKTIEAIAKGQDRVLLVMATGTGKTYTAFQIIWKLLQTKTAKRILFLADRNILINQTMQQDFSPLDKVMTKIKNKDLDSSYEVYMSLYHQLTGEEGYEPFREFKPEFFSRSNLQERVAPTKKFATHFLEQVVLGLRLKYNEYKLHCFIFGFFGSVFYIIKEKYFMKKLSVSLLLVAFIFLLVGCDGSETTIFTEPNITTLPTTTEELLTTETPTTEKTTTLPSSTEELLTTEIRTTGEIITLPTTTEEPILYTDIYTGDFIISVRTEPLAPTGDSVTLKIRLGTEYYINDQATYNNYVVNSVDILTALETNLVTFDMLYSTETLPILTKDATVDQELLSDVREIMDILAPTPAPLAQRNNMFGTDLEGLVYSVSKEDIFGGYDQEWLDIQNRYYSMLEDVILNGYVEGQYVPIEDYLVSLEEYYESIGNMSVTLFIDEESDIIFSREIFYMDENHTSFRNAKTIEASILPSGNLKLIDVRETSQETYINEFNGDTGNVEAVYNNFGNLRYGNAYVYYNLPDSNNYSSLKYTYDKNDRIYDSKNNPKASLFYANESDEVYLEVINLYRHVPTLNGTLMDELYDAALAVKDFLIILPLVINNTESSTQQIRYLDIRNNYLTHIIDGVEYDLIYRDPETWYLSVDTGDFAQFILNNYDKIIINYEAYNENITSENYQEAFNAMSKTYEIFMNSEFEVLIYDRHNEILQSSIDELGLLEFIVQYDYDYYGSGPIANNETAVHNAVLSDYLYIYNNSDLILVTSFTYEYLDINLDIIKAERPELFYLD